MKIKIFLLLISFLITNGVFAQYQNKTDYRTNLIAPVLPNISLGVNGGIAYITDNSGIAVGMFAEIKTDNFSFVPQANYWKVGEDNNFELAGLVRLRFKSVFIEPYIDGGIGINFLSQKDAVTKENISKNNLGLDLGGGVDFLGLGTNFSLFVDGKYKIIVSDPNIKGYTLTGGIRFNM